MNMCIVKKTVEPHYLKINKTKNSLDICEKRVVAITSNLLLNQYIPDFLDIQNSTVYI